MDDFGRFCETFSPVARYDTVRSVIALAAAENLVLKQFDVKTAFLNGELKEEVFMTQPEGFDDGSGRVCLLKRSLYGLKQAPRCWNDRFVKFMIKQGFKVSSADPCLFVRHSNKNKLIVAIYVDDDLIAGSNNDEVALFIDKLRYEFQITMGFLDNFLGVQIERRDDGIFINQKVYTENILKRFSMCDANPVATPCEHDNGGLSSKLADNVPYIQAVGCLIYLMMATRPDIAFAVSKVSRSLNNPTQADWLSVKRIFKYLRGTVSHGLFYRTGSDGTLINAYSDADFAGDKTRRSTNGVISMFSGGAVTWMCQLQNSIALSTTEAEFIAASEGAKSLLWFKRLLKDLTNQEIEPPTLYVDNASAVKLSKNPEFHKRSKHIEIRYYFVRECHMENKINVQHIDGQNQLADILTKPLTRVRFEMLRANIGMNI